MAVIKLIPTPLAKSARDEIVVKNCQRRVSFNETENVQHENKQWCFEDCKLTWWTKLDYQQMKEGSGRLAKTIYKKERRNTCEDSYNAVILRVYDRCCEVERETSGSILSATDTALFRTIMEHSNSRFGLEKISIREISHDRRHRREEHCTLVLGLQASSQFAADRTQAELIRYKSESITRASRLFARQVAMALEAPM
jgi:hypothetical protein